MKGRIMLAFGIGIGIICGCAVFIMIESLPFVLFDGIKTHRPNKSRHPQQSVVDSELNNPKKDVFVPDTLGECVVVGTPTATAGKYRHYDDIANCGVVTPNTAPVAVSSESRDRIKSVEIKLFGLPVWKSKKIERD